MLSEFRVDFAFLVVPHNYVGLKRTSRQSIDRRSASIASHGEAHVGHLPGCDESAAFRDGDARNAVRVAREMPLLLRFDLLDDYVAANGINDVLAVWMDVETARYVA